MKEKMQIINEKIVVHKIANKKISNNEPLERRTEFERKKKMLSKRRPPDNLWRDVISKEKK